MIFIVDDQQAVLDAVTDILQLIELEGLTVDTAASARRTFAQKQNEIQLILLDLTLPDEPGEALLDFFTAERPDIPVVIMSGYSRASLATRPELAAAADVLEKPFRLDELLRIVQANLK
ncbi:MAG: response regulator [Anaerolineales bacterium]|nr:response regulator [Anaerolineales bacterium]MCB0015633.1 response regulator [Anaerolineales bacterium]MCB0027798.1 response regulator [Anaerolineales bacterium]